MEDIAICDINLQLHRLYVSHHTSLHPLWTKKEKEYLLLCHKVPQFGSGCVFNSSSTSRSVFCSLRFQIPNYQVGASALSDRRYLMRSFSRDECGIMEFCLVSWTVKRCSNVEYFFFFKWRHLSMFAYV